MGILGTLRIRLQKPMASFVMLGFMACGSAAGVILDLPEPSPQATDNKSTQENATSAVSVTEVRVQPEIESITDQDSILSLLPKHTSGQIDWTEAIRDSTIRPRSALPSSTAPGGAG